VQNCYRYVIVIVDDLYIIIGYTLSKSHKCTLEIIVGEMNFKHVSNEATLPSSCVTLGILFSESNTDSSNESYFFTLETKILWFHVLRINIFFGWCYETKPETSSLQQEFGCGFGICLKILSQTSFSWLGTKISKFFSGSSVLLKNASLFHV
jgi:hypothetical protein